MSSLDQVVQQPVEQVPVQTTEAAETVKEDATRKRGILRRRITKFNQFSTFDPSDRQNLNREHRFKIKCEDCGAICWSTKKECFKCKKVIDTTKNYLKLRALPEGKETKECPIPECAEKNFMDVNNCRQCGKTFIDEKQNMCNKCGYYNFIKRKQCKRCNDPLEVVEGEETPEGAQRETEEEAKARIAKEYKVCSQCSKRSRASAPACGYCGRAFKFADRREQKQCLKCKFNNFKTRRNCMKCNTPLAGTLNMRKKCEGCGFMNFLNKKNCVKCNLEFKDTQVVNQLTRNNDVQQQEIINLKNTIATMKGRINTKSTIETLQKQTEDLQKRLAEQKTPKKGNKSVFIKIEEE